MPIIIPKAATTLGKFLENQLAATKKGGMLERSLRQAVEGLIALRYGEVRTIFTPGKKTGKGYGTKPFTLKKLRMKALGFADLLIAKKYAKKNKEPVNRMVAGAFGLKTARFKAWKKNKILGKTRDALMNSFREEIKSKRHWDIDEVLTELHKTAAEYKLQEKLAHKLKK